MRGEFGKLMGKSKTITKPWFPYWFCHPFKGELTRNKAAECADLPMEWYHKPSQFTLSLFYCCGCTQRISELGGCCVKRMECSSRWLSLILARTPSFSIKLTSRFLTQQGPSLFTVHTASRCCWWSRIQHRYVQDVLEPQFRKTSC